MYQRWPLSNGSSRLYCYFGVTALHPRCVQIGQAQAELVTLTPKVQAYYCFISAEELGDGAAVKLILQ